MRKVSMGARKSVGSAGSQVAREQLRSIDQKFKPGPTPLEREPFEKTIKPQYKDQLEQMMKLMTKYADEQSNDPAVQNAVALWKAQVQQGTFSDQVKFDFARRFYYWLLGRGTEEDHGRTLWGRGNAAVYNKEVRSYIESFSQKRLQYAQQLALLASVVPTTLNGYYLYFKYIVGGNLKRVKTDDGKTDFWDMSDEDYLADFEMFQMEFDKKIMPAGAQPQWLGKPYSDGSNPRAGSKPFQVGEAPYPQMQTTREIEAYSVHGLSRRPGQGGDARADEIVKGAIASEQSFSIPKNANAPETPAQKIAESGLGAMDKSATGAVIYGGYNMEEQAPPPTPIRRVSSKNVSFAEDSPQARTVVENNNNDEDYDELRPEYAALRKEKQEESAERIVEFPPPPPNRFEHLRKQGEQARAFHRQKAEAQLAALDRSIEETQTLQKELLQTEQTPERDDLIQEAKIQELGMRQVRLKTRKDIQAAAQLRRVAEEYDLESSGVQVSKEEALTGVPEDLVGKSVSVSSTSAELGSSVNSADLSKEAARKERQELQKHGEEDIAINMFEPASGEEGDANISGLINDETSLSKDPSVREAEDDAVSSMESSLSDLPNSERSVSFVSPHKLYKDWKDLGAPGSKIVMVDDRVYKRIETGTELQQMRDFYDKYEHIGLTPRRVGIRHNIANAPKGVFVTERLKDYHTLAQVLQKGSNLMPGSDVDKQVLRLGLHKAYSQVKEQWNDLYNPHNVGVRIAKKSSGEWLNVDVKFFEGGKEAGPMVGDADARAVEHLKSLYGRQQIKRLADAAFKKVYGDFL